MRNISIPCMYFLPNIGSRGNTYNKQFTHSSRLFLYRRVPITAMPVNESHLPPNILIKTQFFYFRLHFTRFTQMFFLILLVLHAIWWFTFNFLTSNISPVCAEYSTTGLDKRLVHCPLYFLTSLTVDFLK